MCCIHTFSEQSIIYSRHDSIQVTSFSSIVNESRGKNGRYLSIPTSVRELSEQSKVSSSCQSIELNKMDSPRGCKNRIDCPGSDINMESKVVSPLLKLDDELHDDGILDNIAYTNGALSWVNIFTII